MMKLKSKRSQTEMITTVLMILVGLAAIAGIAVFIMGQIRGSTQSATLKSMCLKVEMDFPNVISATATSITVRRVGVADAQMPSADSTLVNEPFITYIDGIKQTTPITFAQCNNLAFTPGNTCTKTVTALTAGQKVEIAPVIYVGATTVGSPKYNCPITLTTTVTG